MYSLISMYVASRYYSLTLYFNLLITMLDAPRWSREKLLSTLHYNGVWVQRRRIRHNVEDFDVLNPMLSLSESMVKWTACPKQFCEDRRLPRGGGKRNASPSLVLQVTWVKGAL